MESFGGVERARINARSSMSRRQLSAAKRAYYGQHSRAFVIKAHWFAVSHYENECRYLKTRQGLVSSCQNDRRLYVRTLPTSGQRPRHARDRRVARRTRNGDRT